MLPSTMNSGVRLSIQWWDLQKSNEKGRGRELDPSVRKAFSFQSGWQEEDTEPFRG